MASDHFPIDQSQDNTAPNVPKLKPGQRLFNQRYELTQLLGAGGMGVVWLAQDTVEHIPVALKFVPGILVLQQREMDRIREEVKAGKELRHSRLVSTYGLEVQDNIAAIVMEYVPGWTLRQVLDEHPRHFCEPDDIEPWLRDIVEGLTYLHGEAGRIHRDLKPANVMIETAGRARLMDFGISHRIKEGLTRHSKTGDTSPAANTSSTLAYASPQQLRGEPGKAADDLYSLGALVYELLTGSPPWFRGTPETVRMQILDPQLPLTPLMERRQELVEEGANAEIGKPVPQGWERAVQSCLAKDRAQRPASAGEVLALCLGERDEKAPQQNVYHQPAKTPGTAQATSQSALPDSAPADHGDDLTHVMKRGGLWWGGWLARQRDKWLPHREAVTTWAGRRWALVIGVLYALLMLFLCLAAWDVLGVHKAGTMEVIPIGWKDVFQPFTGLTLAVLCVCQITLLYFPIRAATRRPVKRMPVIFTVISTGFFFLLLCLSCLLLLFGSVGAYAYNNKSAPVVSSPTQQSESTPKDTSPPSSFLTSPLLPIEMIVVPWGIWSVVFYRRMRKADALQEYGRQVQIIRSGSVLDFLIGLPAHLYARNSGECCADVYTFMGLSLGIALAALTFGPAFFFLLIGRCRKQRAKYQPAKSTIRQSP